MCGGLSFCLPRRKVHEVGRQEYITIPGACVSAGVIALQTCGQEISFVYEFNLLFLDLLSRLRYLGTTGNK